MLSSGGLCVCVCCVCLCTCMCMCVCVCVPGGEGERIEVRLSEWWEYKLQLPATGALQHPWPSNTVCIRWCSLGE